MSGIRTCEQYVLAELERLQRENEVLREALELMCDESHAVDNGCDVGGGE